MPREALDTGREAAAPIGNHLGVVLRGGQVAAIPEGAVLILYDEAVGHPVTVALQKVSTGRIVLGLIGSDGQVSTEYTYKMTTGKPLNRDAYMRLKKEGKVR